MQPSFAPSISNCNSVSQENRPQLTYLAEGNANVIYSIQGGQLGSSRYQNGCVLRLRKDLPFVKATAEAFSAYKERIQPLFRPGYEHLLIEQSLFRLDESLVDDAQSILKSLERDSKPNRPQKRRKVYLPSISEESQAILMPNLAGGAGFKLLEFKPKWLLQSPSAPTNAMRCRTCSWNSLRRQRHKEAGRGDSGFCPLRLLADDRITILKAVRGLDPVAAKPSFISSFILKAQPALKHLQALQLKHNQVGLSDFEDPSGKDLAVAMALRDCSLFLIVDMSTHHPEIVEVKFADLELKGPDGGKQEYWLSVERSLLDSGAYLSPDAICALSAGNRQSISQNT